MYWTLELATKLEAAPWPATKDELIDYATRSGAPDTFLLCSVIVILNHITSCNDSDEFIAIVHDRNEILLDDLGKQIFHIGTCIDRLVVVSSWNIG